MRSRSGSGQVRFERSEPTDIKCMPQAKASAMSTLANAVCAATRSASEHSCPPYSRGIGAAIQPISRSNSKDANGKLASRSWTSAYSASVDRCGSSRSISSRPASLVGGTGGIGGSNG